MNDLSFVKVTKVAVLAGHKLQLWFSDGTEGVRDFADILGEGGPMVEPLYDEKYFARVFLDFGAPTWPNGYDIAPHVLHSELKHAGRLHQQAAE
jgi:hypothetical protein